MVSCNYCFLDDCSNKGFEPCCMAIPGFVFRCTGNLVIEFTIAFVSSAVVEMRPQLGMVRSGSVRNAGALTQNQFLQTVYGDGPIFRLKTSKTNKTN